LRQYLPTKLFRSFAILRSLSRALRQFQASAAPLSTRLVSACGGEQREQTIIGKGSSMKRLVSVCLALALIALCTGASASAGPVRVKLLGKALNDYPGTWAIVNGIDVAGKGGLIFAKVDTLDSGLTGTAAWTLQAPAGSAAVLDSANKFRTTFKADTTGFYFLSVSYGGQSATDTIYVSTYKGVSDLSGCACHFPGTDQDKAYQSWKNTGHAGIFKAGVTGNLEDAADPTTGTNFGAYAASCVKCHTTGWDDKLNNNNFGYQAKSTGWDTSWFKGLPLAGGDYWIQQGDTSKWNMLSSGQKPAATIGCESCHGPLTGHLTGNGVGNFRQTVAKPRSADVCNQCHNGSGRHSIGSYYNLSAHAKLPTGGSAEGGRSSCQPCHTGAGFLYFMSHGKDTAGIAAAWNTSRDANTQISCQVCHDPHAAATIKSDGTMDAGLRQVSVDSLRNGYKFKPAGASQVCSYCHSSRYAVAAKVKPASGPYYGFGARFAPHENPQFDMFVGSNGYQFGDTSFTGVSTHAGLENGCVTCHMQDRVRSGATLANHSMAMTGDTAFGFKATAVCASCHGEVTDYNEVKAFYDYDRNGRIEGVQTEIQGLLNAVKNILPKDGTGEVIGLGTVTAADSAKIQGHLELVAGIYNYRFVVNDKSMGVHNAKYAARLLYKTLGWTPLFVKQVAGPVPSTYALGQNYPNPFNPSTKIQFALPKEGLVKLQVFDITGALVKTLLNEAVRAGSQEVTWDGTNNAGAKVTSGMYFYRLAAGNSFVATKKMILLK
jgi:hypothetical protein